MIRITLKKNEDRRIAGGHPWVFSNEIAAIDGERTPGAVAELFGAGGAFMGRGHYNPHSLIACRLLTRQRDDIDAPEFFRQRLAEALAYRQHCCGDRTSFRLVYGESDHLPGLVVDRYGDYLSLQLLTVGMDQRRDLICDLLEELVQPTGIIARNDVGVRSLEGLSEQVELVRGEIPERVEMEENGLRFLVDLRHGQKTGTFLDQRDNHRLLQPLCRDTQVLDCFCHTASWGVHAAAYGAAGVLGVDVSGRALAGAQGNAHLNGFSERMVFEECDAFERLRSLGTERRRFGVIIMDPPAFVKSRKTIAEGAKGYFTINRRAMELLEPGGFLISCSCSYHMGREQFRDILTQAARQAKREVCLISSYGQGPDHPVPLAFPEADYLKCLVMRVR